jgi:hypothetical protein
VRALWVVPGALEGVPTGALLRPALGGSIVVRSWARPMSGISVTVDFLSWLGRSLVTSVRVGVLWYVVSEHVQILDNIFG